MSTRPNGLGSLLVTDLVLPIAAFYALKACGVDDASVLAIGAGLLGMRVLFAAARNRRFDALAVVVMASFALGLITLAVTGSARVVMAADSQPTAVAGLVLLGSVVFYDSFMFRLLSRCCQAAKRTTSSFFRRSGLMARLFATPCMSSPWPGASSFSANQWGAWC
jgi:hypothetical protein